MEDIIASKGSQIFTTYLKDDEIIRVQLSTRSSDRQNQEKDLSQVVENKAPRIGSSSAATKAGDSNQSPAGSLSTSAETKPSNRAKPTFTCTEKGNFDEEMTKFDTTAMRALQFLRERGK
jgi:hypothetical protein